MARPLRLVRASLALGLRNSWLGPCGSFVPHSPWAFAIHGSAPAARSCLTRLGPSQFMARPLRLVRASLALGLRSSWLGPCGSFVPHSPWAFAKATDRQRELPPGGIFVLGSATPDHAAALSKV